MDIIDGRIHLDAVADGIPAHLALLDDRGAIIAVNAAWRRYAIDNALSDPDLGVGTNYLTVCALAHDDPEASAAHLGISRVLASETDRFVMEYPCHSPTELRWFQLRATAHGEGGRLRTVVTHVDITERKLVELALSRAQDALREVDIRVKQLDRIRAVRGAINALIARVRDNAELRVEACRICIEDGGFEMALILQADKHTGALSFVASSGADESYIAAIVDLVSSNKAAQSLGGRALAAGRPIIENDPLNDRKVLFSEHYLARNVRSMAVLPLVTAGKTLGILVLYAREPGFFREDEVAILSELAADVAFGMDHIEKIERIEYLAYFDDCTGLANRTLFNDRVAERLGRAIRAGEQLFVGVFDIDRFKTINDTFGRLAGDSLLRQVAAWLKQYTGDETRVARIGPDQFAFATRSFVDIGPWDGQLQRDIAAFGAHSFQLNDAVFRVSARVGMAGFPRDGEDAADLLNRAEVALKKAKQTGERWAFYTRSMSEGVAERFALENRMRHALENDEFVLHYQAKQNLASGALTGVEALIRWNDPEGGLTPPGRFIPVLEETGLILEVGRWALRTALAQYLLWRDAGLPAVRIAVNVSPLQLRNPDFVAEVRDIVDVDAGAARGLGLEITESLIMADVAHSIESLLAVRAMGLKVAIDDFGTGYSSLSYLAKLPVDTLKIDRSFINDMATGPQGLALVATIVTLAHSLKLNVVAEGVETKEQSHLLSLLGCDEVQRFLFCRPVSAEAFEARYLRRAT